MVRKSGLSGRGCGGAVDDGRSTGTSTVAKGAATMKMISSTSITSMNGVTLISWVSPRSSSPWSRRTAMALLRRDAAQRMVATVEVAAPQPQDFGGCGGQAGPVAGDHARERVVDHDRRDRCDQAQCGGQQRLGDAGGDDREVGRL